MLIAISGSQATGKSTLIKELQTRGYNTLQHQTARSLLKEWNISLQEINRDPQLTLNFQNEIILNKFHSEYRIATSADVWFVERSYADSFAYLVSSIGRLNQYDEQINQYYIQCEEYQQIYDCVFYLKGGIFSIENDGIRNINKHYAQMVDGFMEHHTERMSRNSITIRMDGVKEKADYIVKVLGI